MNPDSVGNTLSAHFASQMASDEPTVQIVWDNGPKLTTSPNPASGEWVRFAWRPAVSQAAAIGGLLWRGMGVVEVQVFTPLLSGVGASERIARSIQRMFRDETISGVVVGPISFGNVGETDGWFQSQVRIRIQADEEPA